MFNNPLIIHVGRIILLVLSQVLIFNRLNFLGFINPMIYIMYLYWYPVKVNRSIFLGISFLLGFAIDLFSDTLAMHTIAIITAAYSRPTIMRFCFGNNYDFQNFKLANTTNIQQIAFLSLLIFIHHAVFFFVEIFSFDNLMLILKKVSAVGLASFIVCLMIRSLFSIQKK